MSYARDTDGFIYLYGPLGAEKSQFIRKISWKVVHLLKTTNVDIPKKLKNSILKFSHLPVSEAPTKSLTERPTNAAEQD